MMKIHLVFHFRHFVSERILIRSNLLPMAASPAERELAERMVWWCLSVPPGTFDTQPGPKTFAKAACRLSGDDADPRLRVHGAIRRRAADDRSFYMVLRGPQASLDLVKDRLM